MYFTYNLESWRVQIRKDGRKSYELPKFKWTQIFRQHKRVSNKGTFKLQTNLTYRSNTYLSSFEKFIFFPSVFSYLNSSVFRIVNKVQLILTTQVLHCQVSNSRESEKALFGKIVHARLCTTEHSSLSFSRKTVTLSWHFQSQILSSPSSSLSTSWGVF